MTSFSVVLLSVSSFQCVKDLDQPECLVLADCPPNEGYTSCEDGYCFKSGKCADAGFKPGDACCPPVEGDRTGDTDCLVLDVYAGASISRPAFDSLGNLFFTYAFLDVEKGGVVRLERISVDGIRDEDPIVVGEGDSALAPLVSPTGSIYVAFDGGVKRYRAETLELEDEIATATPEGGLAHTGVSPRSVAAWPTKGGGVVTYDQETAQFVVHDVASDVGVPELKKEHFLAPVVSGNGRRLYVVSEAGDLVAVEVGVNPRGTMAYTLLPAAPAGPPVESGGRVFVTTEDGTLYALRMNDSQSFDVKWTVDLGWQPAGRPLLHPSGDIVVACLDGRVLVIRDFDSEGSLVGQGQFGEVLADLTPMLTDRPRIVAVGESGKSIVTLLWSDDAGGVKFSQGLRFDLGTEAQTPPLLHANRILITLASQRMLAWTLTEELPSPGYPVEGGDAGNTNKVTLSVK